MGSAGRRTATPDQQQQRTRDASCRDLPVNLPDRRVTPLTLTSHHHIRYRRGRDVAAAAQTVATPIAPQARAVMADHAVTFPCVSHRSCASSCSPLDVACTPEGLTETSLAHSSTPAPLQRPTRSARRRPVVIVGTSAVAVGAGVRALRGACIHRTSDTAANRLRYLQLLVTNWPSSRAVTIPGTPRYAPLHGRPGRAGCLSCHVVPATVT